MALNDFVALGNEYGGRVEEDLELWWRRHRQEQEMLRLLETLPKSSYTFDEEDDD